MEPLAWWVLGPGTQRSVTELGPPPHPQPLIAPGDEHMDIT